MVIIKSAKTLFYRKGCPVVFQILDDEYTPYCIQYAGGGHYYKTAAEAQQYVEKRFKRKINLTT